jgi:CheY-like chemotaxis protein
MAPASPLRILVVDDEPAVLKVTARLVTFLGYEAVAHTDPLEALTAFSRNPAQFAAALLDVMTPGLSGPDLARRLRELSPNLPVLMATGFSDLLPDDLDAGARPNMVLHKPVPLDELDRALRHVVTRPDA